MRLVPAALAAFFMLTALAIAAEAPPVPVSTVSVPWGDWVATLISKVPDILGALLLAAATAVIAMLPAWVQEIVRPLVLTWRTNQLFDKAAAAAIAGVRGATAGRTLDVPVANDLVRTGLQIVIQNAAPAVLDFAGIAARSLAEKMLARLHEQGAVLPPEYTIGEATAQAKTVLTANGHGTLS